MAKETGLPEYTPNIDTLVAIEFKIDPYNPELSFLTDVDQAMVDSAFHFHVSGTLHGQPIFEEPIQYTMQGKKVIKSIEKRIKEFQVSQVRQFLTETGRKPWHHRINSLSDEQIITLIQQFELKSLPLRNSMTELYSKMINVT